MLLATKTCTRCKEDKARTEFYADKRNTNGLSSWCKECMRWNCSRYAERYPEKRVARARAWTVANPERAKQSRRRQRLARYGLTSIAYAALLEKQNHGCAICSEPNPPAIDHCHRTGRVRGILCHKCNKGIGLLQDDPETLRAAAEYLEGGL